MADPQPVAIAGRRLLDHHRGRFAFECITEHCSRYHYRWTLVPEQLGDGLVMLPNLRCLGCGCEPLCVEQPAWGP